MCLIGESMALVALRPCRRTLLSAPNSLRLGCSPSSQSREQLSAPAARGSGRRCCSRSATTRTAGWASPVPSLADRMRRDAREAQSTGLGAEQDGALDLYAAHADVPLDRADHDPLA